MPVQTIAEPHAPAVTPERILQFAWGYSMPIMIGAAVENGLFDALDRRPLKAAELAAATRSSVRGVQAVMDALVGAGLATRDQDGRYGLTMESRTFLVKSELAPVKSHPGLMKSQPVYLGGLFQHITRDMIPMWLPLAAAVRTGKPTRNLDAVETGAPFFRSLVEPLFSVNYPAAQALAGELAAGKPESMNVLDVAAGSGVWGIAIAQKVPQARVVAFDWEPVLPVTREIVERFGLTSQFEFRAGDILEADFGAGFDVATLGQILHSNAEEQNRQLLKKIFRALNPGGTVAIAEFLANDDRSGPELPLIFSVNMLVSTERGQTFSYEEIRDWLLAAGFSDVRKLDAPGPSPLVLADRPAEVESLAA